jgi:hypothetical protein
MRQQEEPFPINDLAVCRDHLKTLGDSRLGNVKLFLSGTVYFMFYEDRLRRPYHSILPKYDDLNVRQVLEYSASRYRKTSDVNSVTGGDSTDTEPPILVGSGKKQKPFKRVILERSDAAIFDEIIVKRSMMLDHIPNVYDKAFQRAFETLMIDLSKDANSSQWAAAASSEKTEELKKYPATDASAVNDTPATGVIVDAGTETLTIPPERNLTGDVFSAVRRE